MRHNIPNVESSRGIPRCQRAVRDQMKIEMRALDQLLPSDHAARVVWEFVRKLDLSEFYADIKAVEGRPGQPPVDPAILLTGIIHGLLREEADCRNVTRSVSEGES